MPRGKKISKPPEFGHVVIGFPDANGFGTLLETSETILAEPGENWDEFLARLKKLLGIGHSGDEVRIVYRNGKIHYARVTRRAYDTIPAAPRESPLERIGSNGEKRN